MSSTGFHWRLRALGIGFLAVGGLTASEALAQTVNIVRGRVVDPPHVHNGSHLRPGDRITISADALIIITTDWPVDIVEDIEGECIQRTCSNKVVLRGAQTYDVEDVRTPGQCNPEMPLPLPDPWSTERVNVSVTTFYAASSPRADTPESPDKRRFREWLDELKRADLSVPPPDEERVFEWPRAQGYVVDICLHWGQDCGEPAATAWCRRRGFRNAIGWQIAEDIGDRSPTMVIGDNQICDQQLCDGFSEIRCGN